MSMIKPTMSCVVLAVMVGVVTPSEGQIDLVPKTVQPTVWERFTLRVINQVPMPTVAVTVTVPEIVTILGVAMHPPGWVFEVTLATDSTPQTIQWTGGTVMEGSFEEFAFLGRVAGDARRKELIFPVSTTKADGSGTNWARLSGEGAAPVVQIVGTTAITPWGAVGLAGGAIGISILALAIAMAGRRRPA